MYIATLIGAPGQGGVAPALLRQVCAAWGGGRARWLADDEAAEFALSTWPGDYGDTWQALQQQGVDLVLQPAGERRKRILLADMDGTMIGQESIDELAKAAGAAEAVARITARAMNGQLDFATALVQRVRYLRGLRYESIAQILAQRIRLTPGARVLVATMKAHGAYAALVSGGFTDVAEHVASALGFDEHRANRLQVVGAVLTGEVEPPILGQEAKRTALQAIASRLGLSPADALAVGDGANDGPMLAAAGIGVAFRAKPALAAQCPMRITHGDLRALLYLQGYHRAEFAPPC